MEKRKTDLLIVASALIIASVLCIFKLIDSPKYKGLEATSVTITSTTIRLDSQGVVNINTATLEELMTLEEIGEKRAQAIIDYRNKNGRFETLDELAKVENIGKTIIELNKSRLALK